MLSILDELGASEGPDGRAAGRWRRVLGIVLDWMPILLGGGPVVFVVVVVNEGVTVERGTAVSRRVYAVQELPEALGSEMEIDAVASPSQEVEPNPLADENRALRETITVHENDLEELGSNLKNVLAENEHLRTTNERLYAGLAARDRRETTLEAERDAALEEQARAEEQWRGWRERALRAESRIAANEEIIGMVGQLRVVQAPKPGDARVGQHIRIDLRQPSGSHPPFGGNWEIRGCDRQLRRVGGGRGPFVRFFLTRPATCQVHLNYRGINEGPYGVTILPAQ